MQLSLRLAPPQLSARKPNTAWLDQMFSSKAAGTNGVIRRAVPDVEREVGREALELEVRRRGFHLIECGGQFIVVCSGGAIRVLC